MKTLTSSATVIVLLVSSLILLVSAQAGVGVVWTGWGGVALAALALIVVIAQRVTSESAADVEDDEQYLPQGYDEVLDELSQTVRSESALVQRESDRVGGLVSDAVETLRDSFLRLNELSERQQAIARDVLDQAHQEKDDGYSMQDFLGESNRSLDGFVSVIVDVSRNSLDIVHRIDDMMEKLEDIFSLIENVEGISSQTNLLALNASIEAARAGEVGRGFAVVADEVRNLSKSSSALNNEIRETIQGAKLTIHNLRESVGAMASNDLSDNIAVKERVTEIMSVMAKMNSSLNSHIEEMSGVGEAVAEAVQDAVRSLQFEDISAQTLSAMRSNLGSIEELGGLIDRLGSQGKPASPEQLSEIVRQCREMREHSSKRYQRPTVSQQSMAEGEVELF